MGGGVKIPSREAESLRIDPGGRSVVLLGVYRSRSGFGAYTVLEEVDGAIMCDCPGWLSTGHCWHTEHALGVKDGGDSEDIATGDAGPAAGASAQMDG